MQYYNLDMSYTPGTHISFKKAEGNSVANFLVEVGTSFRFILTESGYKTARSIPVLAL